MLSLSIYLILLILLLEINPIYTINCRYGYGQRGVQYENSIEWVHNCPGVLYCFEAFTNNISAAILLLDYPWDQYYSTYFVRGCGGDYGTPKDFHPYRGNAALRKDPSKIIMNISTPLTITGQGGKAPFKLKYICRRDQCIGSGTYTKVSIALIITLTLLVSSLLL
jgi:hypothetical protein